MLCIVLKMQLKSGEIKTKNKFGCIKYTLIFVLIKFCYMKIVNLVDKVIDWVNDNPIKIILIVVVLFLVFKH